MLINDLKLNHQDAQKQQIECFDDSASTFTRSVAFDMLSVAALDFVRSASDLSYNAEAT